MRRGLAGFTVGLLVMVALAAAVSSKPDNDAPDPADDLLWTGGLIVFATSAGLLLYRLVLRRAATTSS